MILQFLLLSFSYSPYAFTTCRTFLWLFRFFFGILHEQTDIK
ncbi:hypothetical protein HMPREF9151_01912 [Hoylesella saccharolytica F0055]|uniref:Uncharacterized protein n=1 Tax=Hoylesella saccharolytica F0055 TaxID=1127699 RepID=L1N5B8_9BACT|nr:hypothetical protein HMPREF9151_01912 [Hoylesella saccharolytica F0055]